MNQASSALAALILADVPVSAPSASPKALWEILFRPSLLWQTAACREAGIAPEHTVAVCGPFRQQLAPVLEDHGQPAGSLREAAQRPDVQKAKAVLITTVNRPLLDENAITAALTVLQAQNAAAAAVTVQQKEAGALWITPQALEAALKALGEQGVPFTTGSLLAAVSAAGERVASVEAPNPDLLLEMTNRAAQLLLNETARGAVIQSLLEHGVSLLSWDGVLISPDATIGPDTVIYPNTIVKGSSVIGARCTIGPSSIIDNSAIGDDSTILSSVVENSELGSGITMGPFAHTRPNSHIGNGVHLGNFTEIKNSTIGDRTAVSHLTYVGDSDVGQGVNFGCGCVTVNYDGMNKHRTTIGDHAFIGCNTNLVAPVTVGVQGFTAAGSTITQDVPAGSLAIERGRQVVKEGWSKGKIKLK